MARYSDLTGIRLKLPSGVHFQALACCALLQDEIPYVIQVPDRGGTSRDVQGRAQVLEKALPLLERCAHHFV